MNYQIDEELSGNYQIDEELSGRIVDIMGDSVNDCKITKEEIIDNPDANRLLTSIFTDRGIRIEDVDIQDIDIDNLACVVNGNPGICQNGTCI